MKKPRKKYRPGPINPQAYLLAMMGAARLTTTDVLLRAERVRLAVDQACIGAATVDDWRRCLIEP